MAQAPRTSGKKPSSASPAGKIVPPKGTAAPTKPLSEHITAFAKALPTFPAPPESKKAKDDAYIPSLLTYIKTVTSLAEGHLKTPVEIFEHAFPKIFAAWLNGNNSNGEGLTHAHLLDRCQELGLLDNKDTRRKVFISLIRERFQTLDGTNIMSQRNFFDRFENVLKDYSNDDMNFELFELSLSRWTVLSDYTSSGISQIKDFIYQKRMGEELNRLFQIFRDRLLDYIRAGSQASVSKNQTPDIGDVRSASMKLAEFADGLDGADKKIKKETYETVQSWLSNPMRSLGRESRYSGQEGSVGYFENITDPLFQYKLRLLPEDLGPKDFETIANSQLAAYKRPEDILVTASKACIKDEKKRIVAFLEKYVDGLSTFIATSSKEELAQNVKANFLRDLQEAIKKVSPNLPSEGICQTHFDILRFEIEAAAAQGKISDQDALDSELYIADALLTPQQKIIWIKSLTDDNQALGVDSLKNEGKKLIGYLCYVFRNILEKDSNTPVATTGSISAGFIRGDLTLFFHQAQTGDNKEPNGQFYNCTNNEFEDYAAKKTRIYGPYSLLKSVCEAARKEFEQIVNAPAETANPKSAKGTLVKSSPTPRVPSGRS